MNIEINGQTFEITPEKQEELILQLWQMWLEQYQDIPPGYRILAKPFTRQVLLDMEKKIAKEQGKERAIAVCRPPKGGDPNLHLLWILAGFSREAMKYATICIDTEEATDTISDLTFRLKGEGEGGGPLATGGDIGEREDDSSESPGYQVGPVVSDKQTLHFRQQNGW